MNNFWFDIFFSELSFTNTEKYYLRFAVTLYYQNSGKK
jgi:hypothetical protein